jgi:hypothetical protein
MGSDGIRTLAGGRARDLRLSFGLIADCRSRLPKLTRLERLDIFQTIDDASADFQIRRSYLLPAPPFQGALRKFPSPRQINLVEVPYGAFIIWNATRACCRHLGSGILRHEVLASCALVRDIAERFVSSRGDSRLCLIRLICAQ